MLYCIKSILSFGFTVSCFLLLYILKNDILFLFEYEQTPFDFEVLCLYQLFQHKVEKPSIKYIAFSDDHNNDNDDGDEKFTLLE